jgi:YtfJ family uncharacterized protein
MTEFLLFKLIREVGMKSLLKILLAVLVCLGVQRAWGGLAMDQAPKAVILHDGLGGHLDGTAWSSEELKGKVSILFYVDPDEKDLNNGASEALKAAKFPHDKYQSFGIINMAATWLPNFVISASLKEKQKQYKYTIYLCDFKKLLVKEWGLTDDTSDVLVFDKSGALIFRKDGKLNEEEIKALVKTVGCAIKK